jgi:hypothetical protein
LQRPAGPRERACAHCGLGLLGCDTRRVFCDDACRQRAYRRRRQGLDESAYSLGPGGESARRGPVPMWKFTKAEQRELDRLLDGRLG